MSLGKIQSNKNIVTRREFLKGASMILAGSVLLPENLYSKTDIAALFESKEEKTLKFFNVNTRENLTVTYYENGRYLVDALAEINRIMADRRSGEVTKMDRELIETLYKIYTISDTRKPIDIISAYRSPATNAKMHAHETGVAQNSYHSRGMAIDINIQNTELKTIRNIAKELKVGGVGYYPKSKFVHVDVGPVRNW